MLTPTAKYPYRQGKSASAKIWRTFVSISNKCCIISLTLTLFTPPQIMSIYSVPSFKPITQSNNNVLTNPSVPTAKMSKWFLDRPPHMRPVKTGDGGQVGGGGPTPPPKFSWKTRNESCKNLVTNYSYILGHRSRPLKAVQATISVYGFSQGNFLKQLNRGPWISSAMERFSDFNPNHCVPERVHRRDVSRHLIGAWPRVAQWRGASHSSAGSDVRTGLGVGRILLNVQF